MTMANTENRGFQDQAADRGGAREQIRDVKNQVVDQAKTTFQQAKDRAQSSLGESKNQFAEQIGSVAEALRRTTEHLRSEEQTRFAGLTETLARQVDQVARYLRDKDAAAMRNDVENLARRQPAVILGGALVLGLIGARFIKSSQRGRERRRNSGRENRFNYDRSASEFETSRPGGGYAGGGYSGAESGLGGGYAGA
ncbi:MAG: hypothetical protein ACJ8BF_02230 [Gemmatimonadales bacterium]